MNTSSPKWRAERGGWWTAAPHEFISLPSVSWLSKFLGNVFSWIILLHKSLCFSPWQPENSRAQLSSDSTNRTPQNTHFSARASPPRPAFLQTLPVQLEWLHWPWMETHAGINQATYDTVKEICRLRLSLRCCMSSGFSQLGSVNLREPRLKQQQVQDKHWTERYVKVCLEGHRKGLVLQAGTDLRQGHDVCNCVIFMDFPRPANLLDLQVSLRQGSLEETIKQATCATNEMKAVQKLTASFLLQSCDKFQMNDM